MDKLKQNWYSLEPQKRLVVIYDFFYGGNEVAPDPEYDAKFKEFLTDNAISSDKIIKVVSTEIGHDEIHAYGDGGIEQFAIVSFEPPTDKERDDTIRFGTIMVFLGEIPNMPGHCVAAEYHTGKMHCGMPIKNLKVRNDI